jgi:uncharacterized protein YuzE
MRISYDRNEDILMLDLSPGVVDYAEETGQIIVHFTKEGKPVLLEILDASNFITAVAKASIRAKDTDLLEVSA